MVSSSISVIPSWAHLSNASILIDCCSRQPGLRTAGPKYKSLFATGALWRGARWDSIMWDQLFQYYLQG